MRPRYCRFAVAIGLAASIGSPGFAESAPPIGAPPSGESMFRKFCEDEEAIFKSIIAFSEAKLDVQLRQRPVWEAFVEGAYAAGRPIRALCKEQRPGVGDLVAELDFKEKSLGAFLEMHRSLTTAIKKLIPSLSPEQTRVLAQFLNRPLPLFPPAGGPPGSRL